jgi:hypothetical protein
MEHHFMNYLGAMETYAKGGPAIGWPRAPNRPNDRQSCQ